MKLTSIDFAKLICWIGFHKWNTTFSKTQVQKLLFISYGLYLARTSNQLFKDDEPKAWPFGPVFPRAYKRYEDYVYADLSEEDKANFMEDRETLKEITEMVDGLHSKTATQLSDWSHMKGSPWAITLFGKDNGAFKGWNQPITDDVIKEYFSKSDWNYGL